MPAKADIILGCQWGDEGKGRIVDLYAADYDVVARFGGGDNAGHSIVVGAQELALRIVPSGVMHPHVELFVGGGTVVNPQTLLGELERLAAIGVDTSRVKISDRAHVVLPHHVTRDAAAERERGSGAIGTTGRGIGPAYVDRVARSGIRFADVFDGSARRRDTGGSKRRGGWRRTSSTASSTFTSASTAASGCCSKARKARCSTSATARIRT